LAQIASPIVYDFGTEKLENDEDSSSNDSRQCSFANKPSLSYSSLQRPKKHFMNSEDRTLKKNF